MCYNTCISRSEQKGLLVERAGACRGIISFLWSLLLPLSAPWMETMEGNLNRAESKRNNKRRALRVSDACTLVASPPTPCRPPVKSTMYWLGCQETCCFFPLPPVRHVEPPVRPNVRKVRLFYSILLGGFRKWSPEGTSGFLQAQKRAGLTPPAGCSKTNVRSDFLCCQKRLSKIYQSCWHFCNISVSAHTCNTAASVYHCNI